MTTETPDASQILAALDAVGVATIGQQIEADSIDIHIDRTYAGRFTNYRAVALGWRPLEGWYLLPFDPEEDGKPAPTPDYLPRDGAAPEEIVREVVAMLADDPSWHAA
ncbi:hypothetical protein ACIODS_12030 [Micromonospora chalcea]|uniref:hypothetical protein n=1 Tax=Micromonospora chalcea TaxID=1874 RepID=UPI003803B53A